MIPGTRPSTGPAPRNGLPEGIPYVYRGKHLMTPAEREKAAQNILIGAAPVAARESRPRAATTRRWRPR